MRNRQSGSHGLNEFSSRSHSMLTLTVDTEQVDPEDENLYLTKRGKLTFVDLAGKVLSTILCKNQAMDGTSYFSICLFCLKYIQYI